MNLDGTWLIGRTPDDGVPGPGMLTIDHPTVSQRHAELLVLSGSYYLTDLGSRNGTWRTGNGRKERFSEGYVEPGESIFFGACEVRLSDLLTNRITSA